MESYRWQQRSGQNRAGSIKRTRIILKLYRVTTNPQTREEQRQESDYNLQAGLFENKPSSTHEDKATHFGL